jgi:MFS transporter, Spinster family, sphingosine-1-phosphate transporter
VTETASSSLPGAKRALALLLCINLFNYIDRYVLAAVEPEIQKAFFLPGDINAQAKTGWLYTAFLLSYMLLAPVFGFLADRISRWQIICFGVIAWSLASAASGLAVTFTMLLCTRLFVGVGEAAYGPAAPTIISDLFPLKMRGRIMALFYMAIPVGSALGYVLGGKMNALHGWRSAFYIVMPPGLLLGALCLFLKDPRRAGAGKTEQKPRIGITEPPDLLKMLSSALHTLIMTVRTLSRIRSYVLNTLAMTAMTFAIGGMAFWAPAYIYNYRHQPDLDHINLVFGMITVVAGIVATILGGFAGDALTKRFPGAYFITSGFGMLLSFPFTIAFLYVPFPYAWWMLFGAVFCIFFNTGPSNTALANVTQPSVRAAAFALNIFIIHALGDAISPPLIGWISGHYNMNVAFFVVAALILVASVLWFYGVRFLEADTAAVSKEEGAGLSIAPADA